MWSHWLDAIKRRYSVQDKGYLVYFRLGPPRYYSYGGLPIQWISVPGTRKGRVYFSLLDM